MMSRMNCRLIALALRALMFLYTDNGHEQPKQTNITVSRISAISILSLFLFRRLSDRDAYDTLDFE